VRDSHVRKRSAWSGGTAASATGKHANSEVTLPLVADTDTWRGVAKVVDAGMRDCHTSVKASTVAPSDIFTSARKDKGLAAGFVLAAKSSTNGANTSPTMAKSTIDTVGKTVPS